MGYDLRITRADCGVNGASLPIEPEEWLEVVQADPDLELVGSMGPHFVRWSGESTLVEPWLDWSQGSVFTKNPDQALVTKMIQLAASMSARVVGEAGEAYSIASDGGVVLEEPDLDPAMAGAPRGGLHEALVEVEFDVGERVADPWGNPGTVVGLDPEADWGLGHITVRYDDGRELTHMCVAHGLEPLASL
jgi:hypothetical protein